MITRPTVKKSLSRRSLASHRPQEERHPWVIVSRQEALKGRPLNVTEDPIVEPSQCFRNQRLVADERG